MEIPAEFVLAHPTLCGEALTKAWEEADAERRSWSEWLDKQSGVVFPDIAAEDILKRLRELGYRRYHIGVDFAAEGTESKSAPPQMAPDAKCMCGHEFYFVSAPTCRIDGLSNGTCKACPKCQDCCDRIRSGDRYRAAHQPAEPAARPLTEEEVATIRNDPLTPFRKPAHPPAEPAKPAETPAPDEVESLAKEIRAIWRHNYEIMEWDQLPGDMRTDWLAVARHVLRLVMAARLRKSSG